MSCLSPQERDLIDRAVAAGKVRQIARGVSGLPQAVWRNDALVYDAPAQDIRAIRARQFAASPLRKQIVAQFHLGVAPHQIAEALGCSFHTVRRCLCRAGLSSATLAPEQRRQQSRRANDARADVIAARARRERILQLMQQGVRQTEIARLLGCSVNRVYEDVKIMRKAGQLLGRAA